MTPIDDAVRLIASWGLDGASAALAPIRPVRDRDWQRLLSRIRFERISGLAVEAAAGEGLDLTDQQASQLLQLHRDSMTWCIAIEGKLLALANVFDAEGIEHAVLKGPALAHTAYEEPCLRPFGDLDLLVRSRDYDRSVRLLAGLGHERRLPEPSPGWEARFGKASVHLHPDDGIEVDLHRTLVLGPFGQWIDGDELMAHTDTFELGGRKLPRLDDTGALVNVALHAALGSAEPRIAPLRDYAELTRRGSLDRIRLARWAQDWRVAAPLSRARQLVDDLIAVDGGWSKGLPTFEASARDRRLLEVYGPSARRGALPLSTLRAIPSIDRKLAYAWSLAFPTRAFLRSRDDAPGARFRRLSPGALARTPRGTRGAV